MSEIQKSEFDYATLDIETREFVRQKETAIKARTAQTIIENGRDLLEVKERLEHGQFMDWVKTCFPWSQSTVGRMIQAYEKFGNSANSRNLNFAKETLFLLAQDSTPESAREEAIDRAESGEKITHADAKELVEAHKRIEEQKQKITDLETSINNLKGQLPTSDVLKKIADLEAEHWRDRHLRAAIGAGSRVKWGYLSTTHFIPGPVKP